MSDLSFNRSLTAEIITEVFTHTVKDLRIDFDVTLTSESEANHALVSVYNLSEQSRTTIQNEYKKLRLTGGYSGFAYSGMDDLLGPIGEQIFYGDIVGVRSKKIVGGWVTEIEALDGYADLKGLAYVKTWKAGTPVQTILLDICASIGIPFDPGFIPITDVLLKATSYNGPIKRTLDRICKAFNLKWSIKFGILEIADRDMPLLSASTQIVILSPDTGLVGSPEVMIDDDPQKGEPVGNIIVTSLLNGKMIPMRPVQILPTYPSTFAGVKLLKQKKVSGFNVQAKGIYIAENVRHYGSNKAGQFHTEATCPIWSL